MLGSRDLSPVERRWLFRVKTGRRMLSGACAALILAVSAPAHAHTDLNEIRQRFQEAVDEADAAFWARSDFTQIPKSRAGYWRARGEFGAQVRELPTETIDKLVPMCIDFLAMLKLLDQKPDYGVFERCQIVFEEQDRRRHSDIRAILQEKADAILKELGP